MPENTPNTHPCLSYSCPRCSAEPGQPCRTRGGREAEYPHVRRELLVDEWLQRRALPVRALCCECGNLRYVTPRYRRYDDNLTFDDNLHPLGWRCTMTLKCSICRASTRHAFLRDDVSDRPEIRDIAETRQCLLPGGGLDERNGS
jgi:hypothetical protein